MSSDAACHSDRGSTGRICILYQLDVFYGIWFFFFSSSQLTILCLYEKEMVFRFNLLHRVDSINMVWFLLVPCPKGCLLFLFVPSVWMSTSLFVTRCLYVPTVPR